MRALPFVILLSMPLSVVAQNAGTGGDARLGPRTVLHPEHEIRLARSAAPAEVSAEAGVWVFSESGYELAVPGSNGVECFVDRSWPDSIEPHCFDVEGAATIMRIHQFETELRHQRVAIDEIAERRKQALETGALRLPERPVLSWMMSSAQELVSDDGRKVGAWEPHLMIYYPYLDAEHMGLVGTPDLRHAVLVSGGEATSNLMIVVREAIDPTPPDQGGP